MAQVAKASGKSIPEYSVRNALRTLVRRKLLQPRRKGREISYTLLSASPSRSPASARMEPEIIAVAEEIETATPAGPHKLAVGEALILAVGEAHVESVTNVHGKLIVEHHPRPRQPSK